MARLKALFTRLPVFVLESLLKVVLFVVYLVVAMPLGLLWRRTRPHASWVRAKDSRWEAPDAGRDPSTMEEAVRQF